QREMERAADRLVDAGVNRVALYSGLQELRFSSTFAVAPQPATLRATATQLMKAADALERNVFDLARPSKRDRTVTDLMTDLRGLASELQDKAKVLHRRPQHPSNVVIERFIQVITEESQTGAHSRHRDHCVQTIVITRSRAS
ncbi:MAG TPA: hypothetical protein VMO26_02375, partial [Vicinamibacterales bacterium]|nr:hypothetical protein [Vicinamibacterales bacterium]